MRNLTVTLGCCIALFLLQCTQPQEPAQDTRAEDEVAIRQADSDWSKAAQTNGVEGHLSYYTEDIRVLAPNEPVIVGKNALRETLSGMHSSPGFKVSWQPTHVEAAGAGDMGYSIGTYELTINNPDGTPMTDRGKYLAVWEKQEDGSWKCLSEAFNSDLPATPPPAQ